MAFGDSPDDFALHEAWGRFCDRLKEAGDRVFKDHNSPAPLQRADAFRFLTQNLGQAFDLALETKDTKYPALHPFCTPTRKLGGDAADFVYLQAWIDGESTYRITGNRGTARFLNFTVQGPRPEAKADGTPPLHEPFGDVPEANLFGHQIDATRDGSFELFIGGERQGANWLPTTPGSRKLFLRQGFDRWEERPATMRIERVGMDTPKPLPTPTTMITAMDWAGDFLTSMMDDWPDWPYAFGGVDPTNINSFPPVAHNGEDRKRGRAAANMVWEIGPDEALILEFAAQDSFWMLSNMGVFFNSMDYVYRPVSYTPSRTKVDGDGKIRLILAHEDPLYHNWLDTQGFARGNLTYRNLLGGGGIDFESRLVRRADLALGLPADSARVTPADRVALMMARFNAVRQRFPV